MQFPPLSEVKGIFFFPGSHFDAKPGSSQLHLRTLSAAAEPVVRMEVGSQQMRYCVMPTTVVLEPRVRCGFSVGLSSFPNGGFRESGNAFAFWLLTFLKVLAASDSSPCTKRSFQPAPLAVRSLLVRELCTKCQKEARALPCLGVSLFTL